MGQPGSVGRMHYVGELLDRPLSYTARNSVVLRQITQRIWRYLHSTNCSFQAHKTHWLHSLFAAHTAQTE